MNYKGRIASYLLSPLYKKTNPENTSQFTIVKDSNLNNFLELLIHNTIPVTLYDNLLTFCDTGKLFEMKVDLSKMIIKNKYNVDIASSTEKKLMYDSAKEMYFDVKCTRNKSTQDRTRIKLLKPSAIKASKISTQILSGGLSELCDRLKLLLQEKQAGSVSDLFEGEIVAMADIFLEYKCISTKQHKLLLIKCLH